MNNNKTKNIKVLLTSCGGLTGTYLAKYLNGLKKYQLFGIDNNSDVVTKNWLDYFSKSPLVSDKKYSNFLYKYLNENSIDVIIPVTSYDIEYFANKFDDEKSSAKLMVSSKSLINKLNDKKSCYELLKNNNISVPEIYNPQHLTYPCFAKPRKGTGSAGAVFVKNKLQYEGILDESKMLFTEYLDGPEYTVDTFFNSGSKCLGYNVRRREKVVSGGATITKNCQGYNFQDFISLLEKLGYIGPLNFQFKLKDSMPIIFDVNTRLASGGLALTVKSGFDIPQLIIANSLGDENEFENAGVWSLSEKNKNLTMIKYYEETYF